MVNHLRSHLRAIMALDHRRLIRPGKKSGQIFCVRQVYFANSCQQIWVHTYIHTYTFINPRSHVTIQDAKTVSGEIEKEAKKKLN